MGTITEVGQIMLALVGTINDDTKKFLREFPCIHPVAVVVQPLRLYFVQMGTIKYLILFNLFFGPLRFVLLAIGDANIALRKWQVFPTYDFH